MKSWMKDVTQTAEPRPKAVVHMMNRLRASKNSCSDSKVGPP